MEWISPPIRESWGTRSSVLEVPSDNYYPRLISGVGGAGWWGGGSGEEGAGGGGEQALQNVVTLVHFSALRFVECVMSR